MFCKLIKIFCYAIILAYCFKTSNNQNIFDLDHDEWKNCRDVTRAFLTNKNNTFIYFIPSFQVVRAKSLKRTIKNWSKAGYKHFKLFDDPWPSRGRTKYKFLSLLHLNTTKHFFIKMNSQIQYLHLLEDRIIRFYLGIKCFFVQLKILWNFSNCWNYLNFKILHETVFNLHIN